MPSPPRPLAIVEHPHPALRWKSKPVTAIDASLRGVVGEMLDLMYGSEGVGLAANQVALPWRLFVANPSGERERSDQEFVFINPEITARRGSEEGEEGCLSLPEVFGPVRRAKRITVEAFDLDGALFTLDLDGLAGRVVQHEADHLDGVMFPDRMLPPARREIAAEVADFEAKWKRGQAAGEIPPDAELKKRLRGLEP